MVVSLLLLGLALVLRLTWLLGSEAGRRELAKQLGVYSDT